MTYKDRKKINPWPLGLIVGWGLLSLAGYVFGWVDFEAAPKWAVIGAFVLVLIFQFFLSLIGESVIEDGIKAVIVIVLAMFAPNHPISDPLLAALACGGIAAFITNWLGRATERRLYEERRTKERAQEKIPLDATKARDSAKEARVNPNSAKTGGHQSQGI